MKQSKVNGQQHKKALMIATVPSMIGQFNMANIQILLDLRYTVHVACNFDDRSVWTEERVEEFRKQLDDLGVKYFQIDFARSPKHIGMVSKSYNEIKELLFHEKYTLVHVHTPVAAAEVRLAAKDYNDAIERRVKEGKSAPERLRVIYTAHGFHFYDGAPLKNWILFYPVEKALSKYTDVLITINKEDYKRASSEFNAKKTVYIPGVGVDVKKFAGVSESIDRDAKRQELGVNSNDIFLLSVGELNENKNHSVVIKALGELKKSGKFGNNHIVYMIAGTGDKKQELEDLAAEEGVDLRLLGFRKDVSELLTAADLNILPSIREGLNVSLMEAMASGTPCLAGNIRGNVDLIDTGKGGELFDPQDVTSVAEAISAELTHRDNWSQQGAYNQNKIKHFNLSVVEEDYKNLIGGGITQNVTFDDGLELLDYNYLSEAIDRQKVRTWLGIDVADFLIMSTGELNANKNHSVIIRAISKINDPNIKYIIAGTGKIYEELQDLIEKLNLQEQVHLLGFRTDIPELLHASDCFAFPSYREGLGLSAIEAMAAGLPLLTSNMGGINSYSKNGVTGYKYDPSDVNGFADGILNLKDEYSLKLSKNCKMEAQKYDIGIVNKIMQKTYQEI